MCGGALEFNEGQTVCTCPYCSIKQTLPKADNEKKIKLFERANSLRLGCEFDRAYGVFESIIEDFPKEAEAYWGLLLCKYGIEYVDDPKTRKKVPTCHRSSFDSIFDDEIFDMVMETSDSVARGVYRDEAKQIEQIREKIIELSSKEDPYDIFICYKESDENGNRTIDSVLSQDIYNTLTKEGYKVFFSRISLESKLGLDYEPIIFSALHSAKVMLTIGTSYDYFQAVWVKNEWSRFLKLIENGEDKVLIPCFKDIDAYDLPKEFRKLQAQDLGKIGALQDLVHGIDKLFPDKNKKEANTNNPKSEFSSNTSTTAKNLLARAKQFLSDGQFSKAKEYFEKVLDLDMTVGEAYIGIEMAQCKYKTEDSLIQLIIFSNYSSPNIIHAEEYGKGTEWWEGYKAKYDKTLEEYEEQKRIERQRKLDAEEEERKRLENLLLETEKRSNALAYPRNFIAPFKFLLSSSLFNSSCVLITGKAVTVGDNQNAQCDTNEWNEVIAVSSGLSHTVGLTSDGMVIASGENNYGQCNIGSWQNIVSVAAGGYHTVGLRNDGTVVAVGNNADGQCNVGRLQNIIAIAAGKYHTVCLCKNGTVVVLGTNTFGIANVSGWTDIVAISAGFYHTVGLKKDGTVLACGDSRYLGYGQCNVSHWKDIIGISAGLYHTLGIRSDKTVIAAGNNTDGQCNVYNWSDIVAVSAGGYHSLGLKRSGYIVSTGANSYGQRNLTTTQLFTSPADYYNDRAKMAKFRSQELCQYCGGTFKGLFTKSCSSCGRKKDY